MITDNSIQRLAEIYRKQILREDEYGNILFGDERGKDEPNVKDESQAFYAFHAYTGSAYGKNLPKETIDYFKKLLALKNKGHYEDILKPDNEPVYRGVSLGTDHEEAVRKIYEIFKITKDDLKKGKYINKPTDYTYKPMSEIESWTTNLDMAKAFALGRTTGQTFYGFIMETKGNNKDMLFDDEFTNRYGRFHENEVMRVSKKPLKLQAHMVFPNPRFKNILRGYINRS